MGTRRGAVWVVVAMIAVASCGGGDGRSSEGADAAAAVAGPTTSAPGGAARIESSASLSVVPSTSATPATSTAPATSTTTAAAPLPASTTVVTPTTEAPATTTTTGAEPAETPPTRPPRDAGGAGGPGALVAPPSGPYQFSVVPIDAALAARMTPTSWRDGCPVALADLRYLTMSYVGYDGASHLGEMVVHADVAQTVGAIFGELYALGFPISQMRLIDDFGGDDDTSIDNDNTSAFNCRAATGSTNWSQHAFGRAIDINPIANPYISGAGRIQRAESEPYRDRSVVRPGMFVEGGAALAVFDRYGWDWGGRWSSPIDYQHFSRDGG